MFGLPEVYEDADKMDTINGPTSAICKIGLMH